MGFKVVNAASIQCLICNDIKGCPFTSFSVPRPVPPQTATISASSLTPDREWLRYQIPPDLGDARQGKWHQIIRELGIPLNKFSQPCCVSPQSTDTTQEFLICIKVYEITSTLTSYSVLFWEPRLKYREWSNLEIQNCGQSVTLRGFKLLFLFPSLLI